MWKFIAGVVVGGLIMAAIGSTYPRETQAQLKSGTDAITQGVAKGATEAQKYAADKLPEAEKAAKSATK